LINNAGVGFGSDRTQRETSRDGFELRLAVNYLAPFVLTHELLARSTPTRAIVNVSSIGQEPIDTNDLLLEHAYDGVSAYRRSKLALIMHTFDVAAAFGSIASNALHPGTFLDTGMVRDAGITPLGPATRGADVIAHVLSRALLDKTSGRYFDEMREARPNAQVFDLDARARLRERTLALTAPFRTSG
jgi:NAD(P)-dependent dehydrogenase (short-subunit alcohol dehydrogenase family)